MRIAMDGVTDEGFMRGSIGNSRNDSASWFCDAYRAAASSVVSADSAIEPMVVAGPWPMDEEMPLRRVYLAEEQPIIAEKLAQALGRDQMPEAFVMFPSDAVINLVSPMDLRLAAIVDAASLEADMSVTLTSLDWAQGEIKRASIASRLVHAAESAGLIDTVCASGARLSILAQALRGLVTEVMGYPDAMNGHSVVVGTAPGLITLLHSVVDAAWSEPALPCPVDVATASRAAMADIEAHLAISTPVVSEVTPTPIARSGSKHR